MKFWGVLFLSLPFLFASTTVEAGCNGFCSGGQPIMMSACGPGGCGGVRVCGPGGCGSPTVCRGPSCNQRSFRSVSEDDNKPGVQIGIRQDLDKAFNDNTYWTPRIDGATPSKHIRLDNKGWAVFVDGNRTLRKVSMDGDQVVVRNSQGQFVPLSQVSPEALSEIQQLQASRNPQTAAVPPTSSSPNFDFLDNIQGSVDANNPAVAQSHAPTSESTTAGGQRPAAPAQSNATAETETEAVTPPTPQTTQVQKFQNTFRDLGNLKNYEEYKNLPNIISEGEVVVLVVSSNVKFNPQNNRYESWCGFCTQLHPVLETIKSKNKVTYVNVNIDLYPELHNQLVKEGMPDTVPRTYVMKRNSGKWFDAVSSMVGFVSESRIQKAIDRALKQ